MKRSNRKNHRPGKIEAAKKELRNPNLEPRHVSYLKSEVDPEAVGEDVSSGR
jgi:hypothetical protein